MNVKSLQKCVMADYYRMEFNHSVTWLTHSSNLTFFTLRDTIRRIDYSPKKSLAVRFLQNTLPPVAAHINEKEKNLSHLP